MNMIRHDDPRVMLVTGSVETSQHGLDTFAHCRRSQQTRAMPIIQPVFEPHRELPVILGLDLHTPRLRMKLQPHRTLGSPLIQEVLGQRIRKAKGHEVGDAILLPVREAVIREPRLCVRIVKPPLQLHER